VRLIQTTIQCTKAIRDLWPDPLARQWLQQYPDVFDADDLRLTVNQPKNHFCEWFAAIHLFQRDGAHSLVEKYVYQNHPAKVARLATLLSERERKTLDAIREAHTVQLPDLFVFVPKTTRYWFAEIKGPGDRLSTKQIRSRDAITRELGVPVEIIEVKI
jgi:VRR-NUC domain